MKTKSKKILSLLIVMFTFVTLMMSQFTVYAEGGDTGTTTKADIAGEPRLVLDSTSCFTVKAGVETTISVPIRNISSDYDADKVTATISDEKGIFSFTTKLYLLII